jgi:heptosyltransferase-2
MSQPSANRPDGRPFSEPGIPPASEPTRRILIVQTSHLGDTILSTPLIGARHQLHPGAELWMLTTPAGAEVVRRDPRLQAVIVFDKRARDEGFTGLLRMSQRLRRLAFDRVYALQRSFRTSLMLGLSGIRHRIGFTSAKWPFFYHVRRPRNADHHDVLRNLALLSAEAPLASLPTRIVLFPPGIDAIAPELAGHVKHPTPYVLLAPGSAWETKQWHWEHFRRVAGSLVDQGYRVLLIGAGADQDINRRVARGLAVDDLTNHTSVAEAMALVQHAAGVVCNDSMALHLASAFQKPCVAVFCATSPAFGFGPWQNPRARVVEQEDLACRPCSRHGGRRCPTGTRACMEALTPDRVLSALKTVLPAL